MKRLVRILVLAALLLGGSAAVTPAPALASCGEDIDCWDGLPDGWYNGIEAIEIGNKLGDQIGAAIADAIDQLTNHDGAGASPGDFSSPPAVGGLGDYTWD
jgi:hypothetical protein